ncbi:MAG: hypothetical protein ABIV94_02735 [Acidimicrobiales bacterium]
MSRFRKLDPFADAANAPHLSHDDARYDAGAIDDDLEPIPEPTRGPEGRAVGNSPDDSSPDNQALVAAISRLERRMSGDLEKISSRLDRLELPPIGGPDGSVGFAQIQRELEAIGSTTVTALVDAMNAMSQRQRADLERVVHHLDATGATLAERQATRYEAAAVQVLGRVEQVAAMLRRRASAEGSTELAVGGSTPIPDVEDIHEMLNAVRWDTRKGTEDVVKRLEALQRTVTGRLGGRPTPIDETDDRPAVGMVGSAWFARVERTLESLGATTAAATAAAITAMGEQQRVDLERVVKRIDATGSSVVERQGARHEATTTHLLNRIDEIANALERQAAAAEAAPDEEAREATDAILERLDEILAALRQLVG